MLTQDRLKELFYYDSYTGNFIRIKKLSGGNNIGDIAGSTCCDGYRTIRVDGLAHKAHRLAWLYVYGSFPEKEIDHINGVKHDNRLANLREADRFINTQNLRCAQKNSSSGFLNVVYRKDNKKYRVVVTANGKKINIGQFDNLEAASKASVEARILHHQGNIT